MALNFLFSVFGFGLPSTMSYHNTAGGEYCPFIVSLYDAYKHQAQLRLVMEYMNGGSLQVR